MMAKKALFSIAVACLCWPLWVSAAPIVEPLTVPGCKLTPTVSGADGSYPGKEKIVASNRLAMPAGKAAYADGQRLVFTGRVLDQRCIPVEGAKVQLWQTNAKGKYQWLSKGDLIAPEAAFAGSGTAMTNNMGEFSFDTIFPGPYGKRAPHMHIRVEHRDLVPLTTEVFFRNDRRNMGDPKLQMMAYKLRDRLMANVNGPQVRSSPYYLTSYIELVLRGKEKFRQY